MADRVMAAMEAADSEGGDRRCTCESEPLPDAPCDGKTSHVAYLLVADADDSEGESFNDGEYSLFIDVTDENIQPDENANPVRTLRMRYDRWKAGSPGSAHGAGRRAVRGSVAPETTLSHGLPVQRTASQASGVRKR